MTDVTTEIHPDAVLEAMLATNPHPVKRRNLTLIQQVCQERHALGTTNFSLKEVGEAVNARGGLKTKALWNTQSADYRKLIEAWQAYCGASTKKRAMTKTEAKDTLTRSIADPATRIIVEQAIRERNALRAEVNILKAQTSITIDRRQTPDSKMTAIAHGGRSVHEGRPSSGLNTLEREALEHAISAELWESEGWTEEKHGRVVKTVKSSGRSRTIFKPGFVSAVRKILATP